MADIYVRFPILLLHHDPNFTRVELSTGIAATTDNVILVFFILLLLR